MRQLDSGGIAETCSTFSGNVFSAFTLCFEGQADIAGMGQHKSRQFMYTPKESPVTEKFSVNMNASFQIVFQFLLIF